MLDTFEILTTSGVVLWSRTYAPVGANVINSLIRDVFIEERILPQPEDAGAKPTYKKEGYTLKWTASKDLGLIFVVCHKSNPPKPYRRAQAHCTRDTYAPR
jgi:signal recognition particle receptor subunit alpha